MTEEIKKQNNGSDKIPEKISDINGLQEKKKLKFL